MGRRKSIVRQGTERLLAMSAFGDSKHEDKKLNGGFPARDKIYSSVTLDNYIDYVTRFLRWAQETHGCRYVDEAREYVSEYLQQRILTYSAWTVRAEAAGIAKLYQVGMDELGVTLPKRHRDDITQHREQKWIGHFSPEKNKDLVSFCIASGLRRHETKAAAPDDVFEEDGHVYVETVGKGGKYRKVRCLNDDPLRIAQAAAAAGKTRIFDHIPKYAPIHEYRASYAQRMYYSLARPTEEIPNQDRYVCRGDKKGVIYDKKAMVVDSLQLGHNRLDVVADNYLFE